MAALEEVITGNGESGAFIPSTPVSEVYINGNVGCDGDVILIETTPGGTVINHGSMQGKSRSITTPDQLNTYHFRALNAEGDIAVYMGP